MTAPATTHTGTTGRRVTQPIHHGTGLWQPAEINGRAAQDWELAVRDRVYEQQRLADAEQLNIRPWTSGVHTMWADITATFAKAGAAT